MNVGVAAGDGDSDGGIDDPDPGGDGDADDGDDPPDAELTLEEVVAEIDRQWQRSQDALAEDPPDRQEWAEALDRIDELLADARELTREGSAADPGESTGSEPDADTGDDAETTEADT